MLCAKPIRVKNAAGFKNMVSCGRCISCRVTRRSKWTARILLESKSHASNCFITLTYDEENLPEDGLISKRDCQLFLKRLRKSLPNKIRYFLCGEYGSKTNRAHYHVILFGLPLDQAHLVTKAWKKGFTTCAPLNKDRAGYVAKYTMKDQTHANFAMMSRRPGIGATLIPNIGNALKRSEKNFGTQRQPSKIPPAVRIDGKIYPLDYYTREKLKTILGEPTKNRVGHHLANDLAAEWFVKKGDPDKEQRDHDQLRASRAIRQGKMREKI